ncbi:MAG: hypothetical protein JXR36_12305 [Bacteroidales bacterium]|nr:hypothetical protein [Bacteroidales bacterium]
MAIKRKKTFKIILISIAALAAIFFIASFLLNHYLKRSIEDALNQSLNANIKIESIRLNIFTSKIKITDLSIVGKNSFKNDTLFYFDNSTLKIDDYNTKTGLLLISSLEFDGLVLRNIIDENGTNCWQTISKNNASEDSLLNDSNFSFFINDIILRNAFVVNIDRQTEAVDSLKSVGIKINSKKTETGFDSNFEISLDLKNHFIDNGSSSGKIRFNGSLSSQNKLWQGVASGYYDNYPIESEFRLNFDSIANDTSFLNFVINFDNAKNCSSSGALMLKVKTNSSLTELKNIDFTANIICKQLNIENPKNESLLLDFDALLSYTSSTSKKLSLKSQNFFITNTTDTIKGAFDFSLSNKNFVANSNIIGDKPISFCFNDYQYNLMLKSDLNGQIGAEHKSLTGNLFFDISVTNEKLNNFNNAELSGNMNQQLFGFEIDAFSSLIDGNLKLYFESPQKYFTDKTYNVKSEIKIDKIVVPISNKEQRFGLDNNISLNKGTIPFPQKTITILELKIDSILLANSPITNLRADVIHSPNLIGFNKIYFEFLDGTVDADYSIYRTNSGDYLENTFEIKEIDLSALSIDKLSGIINFSGSNLLAINDTINNFAKNKGLNKLQINDFCYKTDLLKEYEIDEEAINILNADIEFYLSNDSIMMLPTIISVNKALLHLDAIYCMSDESIDAEFLINAPKEYISTKIQFLIQLFAAKSSRSNSDRSESQRLEYRLKIGGTVNEPEYKIYKN